MKIAILGGGMVGACYMQAFLDEGHELVGVCDLKPGAALVEQVQAHGASVYPAIGPWINSAQVVISAVFGSAALPMARQAFTHLNPGALFVDMTTADPQDMREADQAARQADIHFVDVAITGAVNLNLRKTPLLIAGKQAPQVQALFAPFGGRLTVVGSQPGDAAALKLLRSIYTKGVEALAVECLVTAQQMGLSEEIFEVLADIDQTPLRKLLESMVLTHIPHSARRCNEVVEAQHQMQQMGLKPMVSPGVESVFAATAAAHQRAPFTGTSVHEAIEWLSSHVLTAPQPLAQAGTQK